MSLLQQIASRLLQSAAGQPERPVEQLFAESLRRSTMMVNITTLWRSYTPSGLTANTGARCTDLDTPADVLPAEDLQAVLTRLPLLKFRRRDDFARIVDDSDGLLVVFGRRAGDQISEVTAWIHGDAEQLAPLHDAFHHHLSQLIDLFYTINALKGTQAFIVKFELARETGRLLNAAHPRLLAPLTRGAELLGAILNALVQPWYRDDLFQMAEDIAEWGYHLVLNSRQAARELANTTERAALRAFIETLQQIRDIIPDSHPDLAWRLELTGQMLEAPLLTFPLDLDWSPQEEAEALPLLRMWTELHALARNIDVTGRPDHAGEQAWARATALTRAELPALLVEWGGATWHEAEMIRNWMRLWFTLQLITPPAGTTAPDRLEPDTRLDSERWRFRTDVALVMRESLRLVLFGRRHFRAHRRGALAAALSTLVDHHARLEGGLPREQDVRGHLGEIGTPRGIDTEQFAADHLRHVQEIYIAGHFFSALHLQGRAGEPARLVDVLASRSGLRPGQQARREFLAAFSLAALFHDVGMLLFPRFAAPTEALMRSDRELEAALSGVKESVEGAGRSLTERCIRDLEAHECFDTISEPALSRWFDEQRQRGEPDHALLGAWYLLRISQRVDSLRPEVVRAAVRAVLLHAAVGQTVDPDLDPAASLLILCDELFDWDPSVQLRAGSPHHSSRSTKLRLIGFVPRLIDGELLLTLDLEDGVEPGSARCWPRLELRLKPPNTDEMPIFRAWLTMAQNLGRIRRSQEGFGADIVLHAAIPPRLRLTTKSSYALLERAIHHSRLPIRSRLQSWLSARTLRATAHEERFRIQPLGRLMAPQSIRPHLDDIVDEARAVLEELERQR